MASSNRHFKRRYNLERARRQARAAGRRLSARPATDIEVVRYFSTLYSAGASGFEGLCRGPLVVHLGGRYECHGVCDGPSDWYHTDEDLFPCGSAHLADVTFGHACERCKGHRVDKSIRVHSLVYGSA